VLSFRAQQNRPLADDPAKSRNLILAVGSQEFLPQAAAKTQSPNSLCYSLPHAGF
jgi:hypothetical protein